MRDVTLQKPHGADRARPLTLDRSPLFRATLCPSFCLIEVGTFLELTILIDVSRAGTLLQ